MYSSELLRNKKLASAKIINPPTGVSSSLRTQILKYASSTKEKGRTISSIGQTSVCCADTITSTTTIPESCCDLVNPTQYPRGFYGPVKQSCCVITNPQEIKPSSKCC